MLPKPRLSFLTNMSLLLQVVSLTTLFLSAKSIDSYLGLHLEIDSGGRLKQNSTTNAMTSFFQ
jgi:hypothetical protein